MTSTTYGLLINTWNSVQNQMSLADYSQDQVDILIANFSSEPQKEIARGELMQIELLGFIPIADLIFFILHLVIIRYIPNIHKSDDKAYIQNVIQQGFNSVVEEIKKQNPDLVNNRADILDKAASISTEILLKNIRN